MEEGCELGTTDGSVLGNEEGSKLGRADGSTDGSLEGRDEGNAVTISHPNTLSTKFKSSMKGVIASNPSARMTDTLQSSTQPTSISKRTEIVAPSSFRFDS